MPFNSVSAGEFHNREDELNLLRLLVHPGQGGAPDNVILEGPRGMGKTELLKQVYREAFWGDGVVPFYYAFRTATLHAGHFARDYFVRFVRQYLAFVKKDPSLADNMCMPLSRLIPVIASLGMTWLIDLIDDFQRLLNDGSLREQMLGAITAPVAAARHSGTGVFIMLDDFPLATRIYEVHEAGSPGLISLFEGSIRTRLCPHILTGSPDGVLERIFSDNALRGMAERLFLGPLPEDAALSLLDSSCKKMGMSGCGEAARGFIGVLGGNPLYLKNTAVTLRRMHKKEVREKDLWEAYSVDVTEGQSAFYWLSVLDECLHDDEQRRIALEVLVHRLKEDAVAADPGKLSSRLGVEEKTLGRVLEALNSAGLVPSAGRKGAGDAVFEDVIRALYMKEKERRTGEKIRGLIEKRHYPVRDQARHFEIVIPMVNDAELVAARAVEQIGKNINLDQEMINQIQIALIESCINAIEHSGSHDREMSIKLTADVGRLEIVIESAGRFFDPDAVREPVIEEKLQSQNKRGWGLKLMRKIMDEVRVERADDLTRVIMVKNIRRSEVRK